MTRLPQFRISTLLLVAAFVAMASIVAVTRLELARLKASVSKRDANTMPIPADVVAASVQQYLASHPLPCAVTDVRYSPNDDIYKVRYQWTDPSDKQRWSSSVQLDGNGFGEYTGCITNTNFLAPINPPRYSPPLANGDGMWISVSTPPTIQGGG